MRRRARTVFKIFICNLPAWTAVQQIVVQAPAVLRGRPQPDPTGAALAEYFPSSTPGEGDLLYQPAGQERPAAPRQPTATGRFDGKLDPARRTA